MTYRIRNLVIAIGLALVAMMLTLLYVTNYKRSVQHQASSVQVYVASKDIVTGTPGADIVKAHDLKLATVSQGDVVPGAISSPDQISSLVLSAPMYAGEQVTLRRFDDVAAEGVRADLKGTMRAVQVSGDANQLLAGTLKAGDHVDVIANLRTSADTSAPATRIVLRDLQVLTAPSGASAAAVSPGNAESVIVAVTDTQVQRLFFVMKNADWTFELRPVVNAQDSPERIETLNSVLTEGTR